MVKRSQTTALGGRWRRGTRGGLKVITGYQFNPDVIWCAQSAAMVKGHHEGHVAVRRVYEGDTGWH